MPDHTARPASSPASPARPGGSGAWPRWAAATAEALYGDAGFYRRGGGPAEHFRTSVHASAEDGGGRGVFPRAVARLLEAVDERLGRPAELALVDVGAGRGELLAGVLRAVDAGTAARLRPVAVELACPRDGAPPDGLPADYPAAVRWRRALPPPGSVTGLLFANEWLDDVPAEVAERDGAGAARYVHVDPATGGERLGGTVAGPDAAWLDRWWPLAGAHGGPRSPGARAEIGRSRDAAWAAAVRCVARGTAVAVDYAHGADDRPYAGTLTGFRDGRQVRPVPDGSCDVTAHVALDACAAAGEAAVAGPGVRVRTSLATQRDALRSLGVHGGRPPRALASASPLAYLRSLAEAGEAAELTEADGLGGFWWLRHDVDPADRD